MEARAKRLPKLRKIDNRVPRLRDRSAARETPVLDAVDRALLSAIDGEATVHAIAVLANRSDEEIAGLLDELEELGMISLASTSKRPSAPPATRLQSGIRPAMQTSPADLARLTLDLSDLSNDEDAVGDASDPEARLTLPGIGPHVSTP